MVFISYSSKDYRTAGIIKGVLENNRIICWIAPESVGYQSDNRS